MYERGLVSEAWNGMRVARRLQEGTPFQEFTAVYCNRTEPNVKFGRGKTLQGD